MDYEAMGRRIRMYRKQRGLTQAALAESTAISTSFLGHIERGTRIASLVTLVKLAEILEVSLDALVTGVDPGLGDMPNATQKMRMLNDVLRVLNEHSGEWLRDD